MRLRGGRLQHLASAGCTFPRVRHAQDDGEAEVHFAEEVDDADPEKKLHS